MGFKADPRRERHVAGDHLFLTWLVFHIFVFINDLIFMDSRGGLDFFFFSYIVVLFSRALFV